MSIVNDKMPAALACHHRALRDGEEAKHYGSDTVYEATGQLDAGFRTFLEKDLLEPSWKIDGTCCLIKDGKLYRRYDTKYKKMPDGAIPGEMDEQGRMRICWLLVNGSHAPEDSCHLSALAQDQKSFWSLSFVDGKAEGVQVPLDDTAPPATYELVGEMVQCNHYGLPTMHDTPECSVTLLLPGRGKKHRGEMVPREISRHYLVRHGDYVIHNFPRAELLTTSDPVGFLRNLIISNKVEGIVFRHLEDPTIYYKVNRGHIGVHITKEEELNLCPSI